MATVLETFFTRLGFEVDESGLKNAQAKIAGLGQSILGLGIFSGLSLAGLMKLTVGTAQAMGAVQRLSDRSGIATTTIAGMTAAARDFGVSGEGVQGTLENVNKALGGIVTGTAPRMKAVFKAIGLSAQDAAGQQKDVVTFLGDVADKIQGLSTGAQQQILSRLGIDANMVTMLRNGREAFLEMYEASSAGVPPPGDYAQAAQFEKVFNRVRAITKSIGQGIGLEIMKPLGDLIDKFNKWWQANGKRIMEEMRGRLKGWMDAFAVLGNIFTKFGDKGHIVVRIMEALALAIGAIIALKVAQWIGGIISAFGGWGAALLAIGALIWLIIDDFQTWRKGGESVIGYFEKKFPAAFELVRNAVRQVRDSFSELWAAFQRLIGISQPFWPALRKAIGYVSAFILGGLIVAFGALLATAAKVLTAIINLAIKLRDNWQSITTTIKTVWQAAWTAIAAVVNAFVDVVTGVRDRIKDAWTSTVNDWKNLFQGAADDIKFIWEALKEYFKPGFDLIKAQWADVTKAFSDQWQAMTDRIRNIWQTLVGWLEPWMARIEKFFGFIGGKVADVAKQTDEATNAALDSAGAKFTDKAKNFAKKAFDWLPSMQTMPSFAELAGGGGMTAPVGAPITNAQKTQNVNQNTDVKATINVQAPSPELAAEMTANKVEGLARGNTRAGQTFSF